MEQIIRKIKSKKELSGLADSFVAETLSSVLKKNKLSFPLSDYAEKVIIKETRAKLRRHGGQFQSKVDRIDLISSGKYNELLSAHVSTRERKEIYPELIKKIYALHPRSILDIGCGLNPLAIARPNVHYVASDINEADLEIVQAFFKKEGIDGKTMVLDARKATSFPKADVCLLFKVVDLLDVKGHKNTEQVLTLLNCKHIFISFSTKTLSGKPMNHPQRGWIEHLLNRLGYTFDLWKTKNEIFYSAKKITGQ